LAGKQPSAGEMVDERPGVTPRDLDALVRAPIVFPRHRNPMGRILARQTEQARKPGRPDVLQSNETNSTDGVSVVQLRPERRRQLTLHHLSIDAEVDQKPPPDRAVHLWQSHRGSTTVRRESAKISPRTSRKCTLPQA